jgi:outer membrane protein assembly factor BamB
VLWHFVDLFHFDSNPAVVGTQLFAGSGVSRRCKEPQVFCLDTRDGRVLWRMPTDLPAWGSPAVEGADVFIGLGNGRLLRGPEPREQPAGALLCLGAATGQPRWRYPVPDAVFVTPAVDRSHVYFGSRDGGCYCLDRAKGTRRWWADLGSPVMTRPAIVAGRVYAVASSGPVVCLDARTGEVIWTFDVAGTTETKPQLLSSPVVVEDEAGRRIYFGSELKTSVQSAAVLFCLRE